MWPQNGVCKAGRSWPMARGDAQGEAPNGAVRCCGPSMSSRLPGEAPKRGCAEGVNGATPLSQDSRDVRGKGTEGKAREVPAAFPSRQKRWQNKAKRVYCGGILQ